MGRMNENWMNRIAHILRVQFVLVAVHSVYPVYPVHIVAVETGGKRRIPGR
jgi:hypothetical protein